MKISTAGLASAALRPHAIPSRLLPVLVAGVMLCFPVTGRAVDGTVTVDAGACGPAINPFLRGQFIEHLGRCIRGGIRAEMLRDRKFLLEPEVVERCLRAGLRVEGLGGVRWSLSGR